MYKKITTEEIVGHICEWVWKRVEEIEDDNLDNAAAIVSEYEEWLSPESEVSVISIERES